METELAKVEESVIAEIPREVDFYFRDSLVKDAQIPIYKTHNAWWSKPTKLDSLVAGIKQHFYIKDACVLAGISERQWGYFRDLHPEFCAVIPTFQAAFKYLAHDNIVRGLMATKIEHNEKGEKTTVPDLDMRVPLSKWYLEKVERERFGKEPQNPGMVPGGGYSRRTEELFTNEKGELIVKRQTAEIMESYGDEEVAD